MKRLIALLLIFTFVIGSISGAIQRAKDDKQQAALESQAAENEAQMQEAEAKRIMEQAEWQILPQAIDMIANGRI